MYGLANWSYVAYGQVTSIRPVVADVGLLELELGDFTNDERREYLPDDFDSVTCAR